MNTEDSVDTPHGTMVPDKSLGADTTPLEKMTDDEEHGTRTPENKEQPRSITGWKVSIRMIHS